MTPPEVAVVVPLHEPPASVLERLRRLTTMADLVVAVDDGSRGATDLLAGVEALDGVTLIRLPENRGIATAINRGLAHALAEGCEYVVTFDQDTDAPQEYVDAICHVYDEVATPERPVLLGAAARSDERPVDEVVGPLTCQPRLTVIQSGMLITREVHERVGGLREDLVIDRVDDELCLRAGLLGVPTYAVQGLALRHAIGAGASRYRVLRLGPFRPRATFHSAQRRYYIVRNGLWAAREFRLTHPDWSRGQPRAILGAALASVLLEPDRPRKLAAVVQGVWDACRGRTGPRERPMRPKRSARRDPLVG